MARTITASTPSTLTAAEIAWARTTLDRALVDGEETIGTLRWTWTFSQTIGTAQTWYDMDTDETTHESRTENAIRVLKTFLRTPFVWGSMKVSLSRGKVKVGPA